jgi:phosphatidylglycerophosphatase A
MAEPLPRPTWRDPVHLLAFGFGAGAVPKAPGTAGTLVAMPLWLLASGLPLWAYVGLTAAAFAAGVWLCGRAAAELGVHDHPGIVWDEIVGFLVTMTAAPAGPIWVVTGFVLFRGFDILKPWPINRLDARVRGGLGIMVDDLVAGLYAFVTLQAAALWAGH